MSVQTFFYIEISLVGDAGRRGQGFPEANVMSFGGSRGRRPLQYINNVRADIVSLHLRG